MAGRSGGGGVAGRSGEEEICRSEGERWKSVLGKREGTWKRKKGIMRGGSVKKESMGINTQCTTEQVWTNSARSPIHGLVY